MTSPRWLTPKTQRAGPQNPARRKTREDGPDVAQASAGLRRDAGPAVICDRRRGLAYAASWAERTPPTVLFDGMLLHKTAAGVHVYPERTRELPLRDVEIRWLDRGQA